MDLYPRITAVGQSWGKDCHCSCHYYPGVKHVIACCDQCYQQYDRSIMDEQQRLNAIVTIEDGIAWCEEHNRPQIPQIQQVLQYLKSEV